MKTKPIKLSQFSYSIRIEITLLFVFILLVSSLTIGLLSYNTAKSELDRSGEIILKNGVKMVKEAIKLKVNAVNLGIQDIETAQEEIKQLILGPKNPNGTRPINRNVDLGENGYFFILNKHADEIAHPSIEGQNTWLTKDMSGSEFYVAQDIIKKAQNGGGFTYYSWKWPYSARIAPKVSYAEIDTNWDWIIVSSIYLEDYNKGANRIFLVLIYSFGGILIIGFALLIWIDRHIAFPIKNMTNAIKHFDINHLQFTPIDVRNRNEIGLLATSFNQMAENLISDNAKLVLAEQKLMQLNLDLEHRVNRRTEELIETNRRLSESKQMAALAHLVFGIAHEINTPLGNAITLGSYIETSIDNLQSEITEKQPSHSSLHEELTGIVESTHLMNKCLYTTSKLIETFKEVSPSFESRKQSRFLLKDFLDSVALHMNNELHQGNHKVVVNCPDNLMIENFQEDLLHVFRHLIINSVVHGFKNRDNGTIEILAELGAEHWEITYKDNGVGIDPAIINRIFEPFFTTDRFSGSIGLGLFIVSNLVTQKLGGHIQINNDESASGFVLKIKLPLSSTLI